MKHLKKFNENFRLNEDAWVDSYETIVDDVEQGKKVLVITDDHFNALPTRYLSEEEIMNTADEYDSVYITDGNTLNSALSDKQDRFTHKKIDKRTASKIDFAIVSDIDELLINHPERIPNYKELGRVGYNI